jgi:hypothetical protein
VAKARTKWFRNAFVAQYIGTDNLVVCPPMDEICKTIPGLFAFRKERIASLVALTGCSTLTWIVL